MSCHLLIPFVIHICIAIIQTIHYFDMRQQIRCNSQSARLQSAISRTSCLCRTQSLPKLYYDCEPDPLNTPVCSLTTVSCQPSSCEPPIQKPAKVSRHRPPPTWLQFAQIFSANGLLSAAAAISNKRCRFCDQQDRYDHRQNRAMLMAVEQRDDSHGYDAGALDEFTSRAHYMQSTQFGQWPPVYERMPELRLVPK